MKYNDVRDTPEDTTGFWGESNYDQQPDASESDDNFADEPEDDGMAEAAAQVSENWFERVVRETEEMLPEMAAELGWQYPPPGNGQSQITTDLEQAEEFTQAVEEMAEFESAIGYEAEPEDTGDDDEPTDLDAVLAQVDLAMAEVERPVELTQDQLANGEQIALKTAVLEWFFHGEGFTRKVNPSQIVSPQFQAAAQAAMLRASKKGIVCAELDAIGQRKRKFKKDIEYLRLPCDLLRGGMVLVPLANVDAVEQIWHDFKADFKQLVRKFLVVYVAEQQRAKKLQGPLYDEKHYPSLKKVAASFKAEHRWLAFNAPAATEEIKAVAFREANAQIRAQVAEAGMEMVANLRSEAAVWIQWLIEQLAVGEDGKRKSINEAKFAEMQQFFALAQNLNVAGDAEFAQVIEMGKAVIAGRDVKDFKAKGKQRQTADELRQQTAEAFEKIKATTEGWVVDAPAWQVYSPEEV